ncbi:NB-ARC domain-containing protein [Priestia megaterium]|uniref:NB-ARC domain-containing protein n=1 Tax=Priestia megaterium TaxID=1404 RepID=UPI00145F0D2B|nr:NB-ARC domain-containing protein [Priestia megaterium]
MGYFNLSSRIVMFSICTSLEYDLKNFILLGNKIEYTQQMIEKAKQRKKGIDLTVPNQVLNELDLGDFVDIIHRTPYEYKLNNEQAGNLKKYFEKIIPVRNRVMHTRPLELGDRSLLTEVLETINGNVGIIDWTETTKTKLILENDPSKLVNINFQKAPELSSSIYHNLPEPEFDDTGYIGRKKEIKEIKKLLTNNKNQIITIMGNGGIGKTAIAVKTLYELIDDEENSFEGVIWISLKTRTLSKGDFVLIEKSIKNVQEVFYHGEDLVIEEHGNSPQENILNFMEEFKTLLVLDNLETINSEEIMAFLKEIPENSKVLITSRHGIGELEYRYNLEGLNQNDATTYFRELSRFYGLSLYKKHNEEINELVSNQLYSNPLSIKWFISGVYNGLDEKTLIANKNELIEFCMSNVFSKLSPNSRKILQLFLIESLELSVGEIDFFIEMDEVRLRTCINELLTTNMIKVVSGNYTLNDMAKDYLSLYHAPSNNFVIDIVNKRKKLNSLIQDIKVKNENDPFNPKSLFKNLDNKNRKLASYYLTKSLEFSANKDWEEAFKLIDKASSISPEYFEVYKIKAFISAEKMDLYGAMTNYDIALDNCDNNLEKATVLYLYSIFYTIKLSELEKGLELIESANSYYPNDLNILLEKSRVLMYLGQYSEAEQILKDIELRKTELDLRLENIFVSRYAELYRRQAEKFEYRDFKKKFELFKKGIIIIESATKIDTKTYLIMTNILSELASLYYDQEAMEFLNITLEKHFNALKSINHRNLKRMRESLTSHKYEIPNNLYSSLEKYVYDYKSEAKNILSANEGIIVFIKEHFGFIANAHNQSIYFNINNLQAGTEVGDRVSFDLYTNHRGEAARNIKLLATKTLL